MAEDEITRAHGVNISRHKGCRKLIIVRELLVIIAHDKEGLNGIDVIIGLNFILQRSKGLVQRVCRYITDTAPENIANAQSDNQFQVILRDDALGIIIMYFKQERIGYLHPKIVDILVKRLKRRIAAPLEYHVRIIFGIGEQILTKLSDSAKFAVQMVELEFLIYAILFWNAGNLHRQIISEESVHDGVLRLINEQQFHRTPEVFIDIGLFCRLQPHKNIVPDQVRFGQFFTRGIQALENGLRIIHRAIQRYIDNLQLADRFIYLGRL